MGGFGLVMTWSHRLTAGAAIVLAALSVGGCSDTPQPEPTRTAAPTSTPTPSNVVHLTPAEETGETVIKTVDNQQGAVAIGDFTARQRYALVYVTCAGPGNIRVTLEPLGTYPLQCAATGIGSRNQFEVGAGRKYSVSIDGDRGQTWAVTLAEANSEG